MQKQGFIGRCDIQCQSELKRGYLPPDRCNLPSPPQTSRALMKYLCMVQTSVTHRSCLLNMFYSAPQGIRASFPIPSACWSSPSTSCARWSETDFCLSEWEVFRASPCGVENGQRRQRLDPVIHRAASFLFRSRSWLVGMLFLQEWYKTINCVFTGVST